ncbi:Gfo/Idh/MocA family oxidoreductase [Arthrobacter sp. MA-N2]|uniref:Gfo/Idh/MocA family oxidoreductase n=1 Tax=Arthrobacter sp. MA-N2 TaxID=1101188 RepID=UPI001E466F4E|nr:Gfo/Idh/MocA family oxidoreductase [Arthrobacter sp. MA-N2]
MQETKNGEVAGIASRTEERAREYADKHGVPQAFGSYGALLASPDIDAVYIALPNTCTSSGWNAAPLRPHGRG